MTDSSPSNDPVVTLDSQAVLTAVTALCGPDRIAAARLKKGFKRLITSENWSTEIERLERFGLSSRHFSGQLR